MAERGLPADWYFEPGRQYTAAEFDAVPRPVCPACGQPMYVERVPVGGRVELFIPGLVRCLTPGCLGPRR